ncbi:hypothetical protein HMPREF1531_01340 [Propionibacterium sp. oral taxon 192 str. F0372]|uniref:histone-like nucleoid-structuring protein Lsr2 n=1 Tax=Propionibacterium sp. oral taxon 192 TaxID=671222 RepID=UPI000352F3FE|nr:Lsr2 family protein [Propionibacterium sp. oral taxon 192]EPH03281.1 hypothetical protein HMPREF1531_01340 [Propionibacterium sp. oral taxon 192 str. F0372]
MAERVVVTYVDDLDGSDASEKVQFSLDGVSYEIDLSEANAVELREALAPYIGVARRLAGSARRRMRRSGVAGPSATEIRNWAQANGYEVSSRGRVSAKVREAYAKANA